MGIYGLRVKVAEAAVREGISEGFSVKVDQISVPSNVFLKIS